MNDLVGSLKTTRPGAPAGAFAVLGALLATGAAAEPMEAQIRWTSLGIPHVQATNMEGLGYGYGYAVARSQLCLLADLVLTVRGERSRQFGADGPAYAGYTPSTNIDADIFYRIHLSDAAVAKATSTLSRDAKDLARGYAAGVNRYLRDTPPQRRPADCRDIEIPSLRDTDVIRMGMQVATIWAATVVGNSGSASAWNPPAKTSSTRAAAQTPLGEAYQTSVGSNSWAYGSKATGTGAGMMVANPHTTWSGWLRMHVGHFVIPGKLDLMGADFLGWPLPLAGFNRDVAWSIQAPSTVTFIGLYKLDVTDDPVPGYTVDGRREPLTLQTLRIGVKQAGGVEEREYKLASSRFGPVYKLAAAEGRAEGWYAVIDAGHGNAGGLDQQLQMAQARNVRDLRKAIVDNRGITAYFVAADRNGETLLAEAGNLPAIDASFLSRCGLDDAGRAARPPILDGRRSACSLYDRKGNVTLAPEKSLPAIVSRDIVANSNDSYRLSLFEKDLDGYSILLGDSTADPGMRARMSHRMLKEVMADGRATPAEALDVIFNNRSYAGETAMDAFGIACDHAESGSAAARACATLANWDRRFNADSRGAAVFYEAWQRMDDIPGLYAQPFDSKHPLAVRALGKDEKTAHAILEALEATQKKFDAAGLQGNEPWGQILARKTPQGRVGLHGGLPSAGVINAIHAHGLTSAGYEAIVAGPSYIQLVTWDKAGKLDAKILHVHGQSSDPTSPHYTDQLGLYARKELVRPPLTDAEIAADPQLETLLLRE